MALPTISNRTYFPAHVMNVYSQELLDAFAWATSPRAPFESVISKNGGGNFSATGNNMWQGYMLYTGDTDTFRYAYYQYGGGVGATVIQVNAQTVHTNSTGNTSVSGTVDISGLSLTAGGLYSVTFSNASDYTDPRWAGMSKTINYTTPPTFADTNVLTAANINTLRTGITELISARDAPFTPNAIGKSGNPGHRNGVPLSGNAVCPWRAWFYHTHDDLYYTYRCGISSKNFDVRIRYNTYLVHDNTATGYDHSYSGGIDLTGYFSPTAGTLYECYIQLSRSGTSATTQGFLHVSGIWQYSTVTATPPPVWAHGGTNVSATNMNRYSTLINQIHPGAGSPTAPLYYEQPAVKIPNSREFYIQHRRPWLRYRPYEDGDGHVGPDILYGPGFGTKVQLPASDTSTYSYNLTQLENLVVGQYYKVRDVNYAQESDEEQPG